MGGLTSLPVRTVVRRLRALFGCTTGVSAVEFALLLPIMLILYAGCAELTTALTLDRKTSRAASTLADLLAQDATEMLAASSSTYATDASAILDAAQAIFQPYTVSPAKLLLMVVSIDSATVQKVVKCSQRNDTCASEGASSPLTVPTTVATSGQVIIGRVKYTYTSPFSGVLQSVVGKDTYNLSHVFYLKPRTD